MDANDSVCVGWSLVLGPRKGGKGGRKRQIFGERGELK